MRIFRILALVLVFYVACHAAQEKYAAGTFWVSFREAVLANNHKQLMSMTRLPLEVRGVTDTPARYYGKKEMPGVLKKILMQPEYLHVNGRIVSKTVLGLIYEKKSLQPQDLATPEFFRFYQLEFQKINGRWFFTRAYLEE